METVLQELYDNSLEVVKRLLKENESLRQQLAEWETLKDANALYVNLLSGRPAQLSIDHKKGLLGQQLAEQTSGEHWHGHEFKELKHGLWKCKCGKELHTNPNVDVLVEALRKIASFTQDTDLLWWQKEARAALSSYLQRDKP